MIEQQTFLEIELIWQERLAHPLSGTPEKKDYQTSLFIIDFSTASPKKPQRKKHFTFDFWIIPGSIYAIKSNPLTLVFLYGKGDEYAINPKVGFFIEKEKDFYDVNDIMMIYEKSKFLSPSPDKKWLFVAKYDN
ncbi:MAG: hypothetical protein ABDH59_03850 [Fervidobacterium sp.]